MKKPSPDKILFAIGTTALIAAATLLLLVAFGSLGWRIEHDTPLNHYVAFLMDKYDRVPYRDIFDLNMPGTYAFHYAIGKVFGYGDLGFRIVDLGLLSVLLGTTYLFMSRFGRLVSVSSAVFFGLLYLSKGQRFSLQRDYIGIIPVALALLCIPATTDSPVRLTRFVILGLLFGTSFLIKPHLAISLPVVFGTLVTFRWNSQRKSSLDLLKCGAICGISFCVPLLAAITWLVAHSAFVPFIDLWVHYAPLVAASTNLLGDIEGFDRFFYLIENTIKMRDNGILFVAGLFGCYRVFTDPRQSKANEISCMCLLICTGLYAVYPMLSGKFYNYHYMPLQYFCAISAGLCLSSWPAPIHFRVASLAREALPLLIFLTAVTIYSNIPRMALGALYEVPPRPEWHAPKGGRVDAIATWLRNHLRPGDSVQPLEGPSTSIHAMLISEARLATRFMNDFHFYHHVSTPFIQELRKSFMRELRDASPRFIIEVHKNALSPKIDPMLSFPELRNFLDRFYVVVFEGNGYLIRERGA